MSTKITVGVSTGDDRRDRVRVLVKTLRRSLWVRRLTMNRLTVRCLLFPVSSYLGEKVFPRRVAMIVRLVRAIA